MSSQQTNLPFDAFRSLPFEATGDDRIERAISFMSSGIAAILEALPIPRRAPSESTKALHLRVTLERRNGYCPCCESVLVCTAEGKLSCAQFDHWYSRHRNEPEAVWVVCGSCNRALEDPHFKASVRSSFYSYQLAVMVVLAEAQPNLFDSP